MRTALVVGGVPLAHQLYRLGSGVEVWFVAMEMVVLLFVVLFRLS